MCKKIQLEHYSLKPGCVNNAYSKNKPTALFRFVVFLRGLRLALCRMGVESMVFRDGNCFQTASLIRHGEWRNVALLGTDFAI